MNIDRFVLILVLCAAAGAVTLWLGALIFAISPLAPQALFLLIPAGLAGFVVWRVIDERLARTEDDHYEEIEY